MRMTYTTTGTKAVVQKLRMISKNFPDLLGRAIYQEAHVEMTESKRRVPVQFGVLKASGMVSLPERRGRSIWVTLSYGGAAEAYALIVHEDLYATHRIGRSKYLSSVLNESRAHMAARIARRVQLNALVV